TWYDVYVHHQVVFPLTPGSFSISPATVSYSLPLTYSFLSREVQHEPQSEPRDLDVLPQPTSGRPIDFDGTSASNLELQFTTLDTTLAVGEAATVTALLSGKGNVALWPEPNIDWPEGTRVYPDAVEVDLESRDDGMWGTKTFRYLLVIDSYGTHRIPELTYHYYDPTQQEYASLTTLPIELVTEGRPPGPAPVNSSRLPLTIVQGGAGVAGVVWGWAWWIWIVIILAPPAAVLTGRLAMRLRRNEPLAEHEVPTKLELLESRFGKALGMLVRDPEALDGDGLVGALCAAGVDKSVSEHAARVRERLWQASYGPEGGVDPEELSAEVVAVTESLDAGRAVGPQQGAVVATALLLAALIVPGVEAQSAERLYDTGAVQEAADSFRLRATNDPLIAAHWYNLGSALYRTGDEIGAEAAWIRAARLAPRNGRVREALDLLPRRDRTTRQMTWISRITPAEAFLAATVLWIAGWTLVGFRRRKWVVAAVFALSLAFAALGVRVKAHYNSPVALVSGENGSLREAPYGSARTVRLIEPGSAVYVDRREGDWILARRAGDRGWVLANEVVQP
ncbi:MAG: BatD family protein, partial [Gemmatimonadota bacterium]